ncbi:MAG: cytochrome c oxidase subunit 4 [Acidimicrobiales bacterium]|nr:cytochrome c oxidase subunit 4 [Actinomycetota bacterium]
MKVEWMLFAGAGAFFALTGSIYWFVSYEQAGTTMLALAVAAVLMVAGWLALWSRRGGARPEDRGDADPGDEAGDIGYFPSSSIWPFAIACGGVVLANALVFGVWLGLTGAVMLLIGVIGYAAEASSKA